jgi:hypothetical protein
VTALPHFTTGIPALDGVLEGLRPGDNVVLQVDSLEDYLPFVEPYRTAVIAQRSPLVYFRFAGHAPLFEHTPDVERHDLHPEDGFEAFISEIFRVIEQHGRGACYVFDCLSELAVDWYSDRMLANFFMLTCPYLYSFDTIAYFALLRNRHTALAIKAIHGTAQVVIDVYRHQSQLYVQPRKVFERMSPTMYMLHSREGDTFTPVTQSATIADIKASTAQQWRDFAASRQDYWTRTFVAAEALLETESLTCLNLAQQDMVKRLCRMVLSQDERLLALAEKHLTLYDLTAIGRRLIGSGMIGGKSAGMILARAVLLNDAPSWHERLEPHDSFFIGTDIFYSYLITNRCWWMRRELQRDQTGTFERAIELRERIKQGQFDDQVVDQFREILEYFGQSPIIVRSSSLLEDAYGNAFSGKYESVFCANQGTPEQRLEAFLDAVRTVYASTMNEEALAYRAHFGLLQRDEQMALLVQRVSGNDHTGLYFPVLAGVGFSFNPFAWSRDIDPQAGVIRLVFGLGTRAVERHDDDYTRIVALNAPLRRPDSGDSDVRRYSQKQVDVLDLVKRELVTRSFQDVVASTRNLPISLITSHDQELAQYARERGLTDVSTEVLTFDGLLRETRFTEDIRCLLQTLEQAYAHPVDIEFAVNFLDNGHYRIHLLQCRPFQVRGELRTIPMPTAITEERTLFETSGPVIGQSLATPVDAVIYVVPSVYGQLPLADRYATARLIGRLTRSNVWKSRARPVILLLGPGRWATTTPALGVPVAFSEIHEASIICEIPVMHEGLVPDVSLGTHFFNDLVEMQMLYLAIYPNKGASRINEQLICSFPNAITSLLDEPTTLGSVVHVIQASDVARQLGGKLMLNADSLTQRALLYVLEESHSLG